MLRLPEQWDVNVDLGGGHTDTHCTSLSRFSIFSETCHYKMLREEFFLITQNLGHTLGC